MANTAIKGMGAIPTNASCGDVKNNVSPAMKTVEISWIMSLKTVFRKRSI